VAQGNPNTATLSGMCLFRSAPTQSLERLTPLLHERSLPAGASVLTAEQPGEAVYVLLRAPSRPTSSRPAGGGDLGHQIEVPVTAQDSWLAGVQSFRKPLSERVLDVMYTDLGPVGEDSDHVEAQGIEGWFSGVEVVFGYGADGVLLAEGNGFQWVSEAGPAPQLDFHEDERLGSNIQTLTTPELIFRAQLTEDGALRLELARAMRPGTRTYAL
jgi:hypothetical protein